LTIVYSSLITDAVLPVADAHDIPMLIAGAAADRLWEQGYRNAVGIYTPASKFALGFLELLVLNDLDRVVLVHADDPFSVDLATHIQKWAPRFELKILDVTPFRKRHPGPDVRGPECQGKTGPGPDGLRAYG
jgi:branched-chain amino acid transport system substrate-binding protein